MYALISFLCVLASLTIVGFLQNFGTLNLGVAIFISLFPLGFIIAAAVLKRKALSMGATGKNKNLFKFIGLALVLVTLGIGGWSQWIALWKNTNEAWVEPVLVWLAILALFDVLTLILEFTKENKTMQLT